MSSGRVAVGTAAESAGHLSAAKDHFRKLHSGGETPPAVTRECLGALLAGILADAFGLLTAIWTIAGLTALSGAIVATRMYETHPRAAR
jgi:hypothetical protein